MPNTLAADPNSQYPTLFELESGKKPLFPSRTFPAESIVSLRLVNGDFWRARAPGNVAALLLNRMDLAIFAFTGSWSRPKAGWGRFMHCEQTKKSLDRRGAARRNPGRIEAIDDSNSKERQIQSRFEKETVERESKVGR